MKNVQLSQFVTVSATATAPEGRGGATRRIASIYRQLLALGNLFANAGRELARLPSGAREGKALRSLVNHREGLSVFVDRPRVPLDNNLAERLLRGPVIGRRLSFGSDSETGARFTALMYSVVGTLRLNGIDVQRWLTALAECPAFAGSMVEERGARTRPDGAGMTDRVEWRYQGHDFGKRTDRRPAVSRHALSREFCRRIGWFKPDGGLKDMTARVAMLAMHNDGLITLPPQKWRKAPPRPIIFGQDTEVPLFSAPTTLDEVRPLELRTVCAPPAKAGCGTSSSPATTIWDTSPSSARRCATPSTTTTAGRSPCSASAPAWTLIGWTHTLRKKNLPLVINNPRFLILPWIRIPNLGSHILSLVFEWTRRYNTTPVLIETFVEIPRYTVYRASGWMRSLRSPR